MWFAQLIGPTGRVHAFEPAPRNRELLEGNLGLNPQLAPRIVVHHEALGACGGERVWIDDVIRLVPAVLDDDRCRHRGARGPRSALRRRTL